MDKYSSDQIINAFKTNDSKILNDLYVIYYPMARKLVKTHKNCGIDAQDLLSDALMAVIIKIDNNDLILRCQFSTYLYSICSHILSNKLRHRRRHPDVLFYIDKNYDECSLDPKLEGIDMDTKKYLLYLKHFAKISILCQKVLRMFFDKVPLTQIAKENNTTIDYAKTRKYKCKKGLVYNIMSDSEFDEIMFNLKN